MTAKKKSSQPRLVHAKAIGTAAAVISCIVALFAYFRPWDQDGASQARTDQGNINQSTANQGISTQGAAIHGDVTQTNVAPTAGNSVTAIGDNPTAVGGNLHINSREVRHQYDAGPERELAVRNYLQVAQDSCGKQVSMITNMNKDTVMEMTAIPGLYRSEMYPTELVAEHLGEDVYGGIRSRVEAAQKASAGAMGLLLGNAAFKRSGMQPEVKPEQLAAFEKGRSEWLQATHELCVHFTDVRRKHSI
jgi:hypothetical protein